MDVLTKVKSELQSLTGTNNAILLGKGADAVAEVMSLVKRLGKQYVLVQDQGNSPLYKQYALKNGLMCIELKTDYGLTNLEDLDKKANKKAVFLVHSLPGYHAEEQMQKIAKICAKNQCTIINDVCGSLGTKNASVGDIKFTSFNQHDPADLGMGAAVMFNDHLPLYIDMIPGTQWLWRRLFNTKHHFKDVPEAVFKETELERLYRKLTVVRKKQKAQQEQQQRIKQELKKFDVIHPTHPGINVIVGYQGNDEKIAIIKYCEIRKFPYTECPRLVRVNDQAISIELRELPWEN